MHDDTVFVSFEVGADWRELQRQDPSQFDGGARFSGGPGFDTYGAYGSGLPFEAWSRFESSFPVLLEAP